MEQLLRSFSLGLLLRSLFAGVFLVVSYTAAVSGVDALSGIIASDALGKTIALSLFVGVVAYTFHRSIIYPLIEWVLNSQMAKGFRSKCPLISVETIDVLQMKWDYAAKDWDFKGARSERLSSWADFAHLQYVSGFCIAVGAWAGAMIGAYNTCVNWPLAITAIALLAAALISDWRLHAVREKLIRRPRVSV